MTVDVEHAESVPKKRRRTIEEILAEVDSKPMSAEDFETPGAFDDEEELEEFLASVREWRSHDLL